MAEYQGPTQPHMPLRVVEPGTPEHEAFKTLQEAKPAAYERRFEESSHLRPAHWDTRTTDAS